MTITAPVPVHDLGDAIRGGLITVRHEARLHAADPVAFTDRRGASVRVELGSWRDQLVASQATVTRAIERTLQGAGIALDEGHVGWALQSADGHWTLLGEWWPL